MTRDDFLRLLRAVNTGRSGDIRAPHKPLLLLLALGRVARGKPRLVSYREAERHMKSLLGSFGQPKKPRPEFPFGRLRNDGLWEIPGDSRLSVTSSGDLSAKEMRERSIEGGFPEPAFELLASDPDLVAGATRGLLIEHFPRSLHEDIRNAVGVRREWSSWDAPPVPWPRRPQAVRERRDSTFRDEVLREYERRCAICGFDVRLNDQTFGLEAAHIQWHSHAGPDDISNGLALCVLHHKALDRGALGLAPHESGYHVIVSAQVCGLGQAVGQMRALHQEPVRPPMTKALAPSPAFVEWHRRQVFRDPPRPHEQR